MSECQTKAGNQECFGKLEKIGKLSLLPWLLNKKCLNVRQKLGTRSLTLSLSQSLNHSLSSYWTTFVFMSMLKSHSLTLTLSHSHTISLSQCLTLTISIFHSLIHSLSTCWTTFVFMSMLKSHSLTLTKSQSVTLTLSHSFTLSFTHSWHAEELVFSCLCSKVTDYRWKWQWFLAGNQLYEL